MGRGLSAFSAGAACLLVVCACGGGGSQSTGRIELVGRFVGVEGTVLQRVPEAFPVGGDRQGLTTIVAARSRTPRGLPVGPANRFGASTRTVTVLAHVGALAGRAALRLRWYVVDGAGVEALLATQTIAVDAHEWAWSTGRAPEPVRPGLYEVVARLKGGYELATWFRIAQPPLASAGVASPSPGDPADFNSWSDGVSSDAPTPTRAPGGGCTPFTHGDAFMLSVEGGVSSRGACDRDSVTISAAVSGNPVEQARGIGDAGMSVDPCELPGGNDTAGTVVHLLGRDASSGSSSAAAVTLYDLGLPPFVAATSEPADGTKVHAGQEIKLKFGAVQLPFAPGIKKLEVLQDGTSVANWTSPSGTPKPCDKSRFIRSFAGTITVEQKPPRIVEVVVRAEDYGGRFGWEFLHFPTQGATWSGTLTGSVKQPVPAGLQEFDLTAKATLTEDAEGSVTGVLNGWQIQTLDLSNCPSVTQSPGHVRGEVSGTFKNGVLSLELGSVSFTKPGVTPCPFGPPGIGGPLLDPLVPGLGKALASITQQPDGAYRSEATGSGGTYTVHYTIDLKRTA